MALQSAFILLPVKLGTFSYISFRMVVGMSYIMQQYKLYSKPTEGIGFRILISWSGLWVHSQKRIRESFFAIYWW
jgi:hypothetical protein